MTTVLIRYLYVKTYRTASGHKVLKQRGNRIEMISLISKSHKKSETTRSGWDAPPFCSFASHVCSRFIWCPFLLLYTDREMGVTGRWGGQDEVVVMTSRSGSRQVNHETILQRHKCKFCIRSFLTSQRDLCEFYLVLYMYVYMLFYLSLFSTYT